MFLILFYFAAMFGTINFYQTRCEKTVEYKNGTIATL